MNLSGGLRTGQIASAFSKFTGFSYLLLPDKWLRDLMSHPGRGAPLVRVLSPYTKVAGSILIQGMYKMLSKNQC